ncbi:MAG: GPP34 family phosphoprotein [Gammaproteobacteria bacterium]|nr:GPP34 family phosphoprotein [Gammaproteobacteria bacterium]
MLTFTEELLLLLGDEEGLFLPVKEHAFECALAGAILMDLAFDFRIDTDLQALVITDPTPTGNPMLDRVLEKISVRTDITDTPTWIRVLATEDAALIREQALDSLVNRRILERQHTRFLGIFRSVCYSTLDEAPLQAVKSRIEDVVSDEIPDPRDVALISLVDACQILPDLFPEWETKQTASRLELLRRMDLIGRELTSTISEIQDQIIRAARAQAAHFKQLTLTLALVASAAVIATLLVPGIGIPDHYGPSLPAQLWFDDSWKQFSGYLLLALSLTGLMIALALKKQLLVWLSGSHRWRLSHLALGIACVFVLFMHTGFRLGDNLNAALMATYLTVLLSGALTGVVVGGAPRIKQISLSRVFAARRVLIWVHALALCPLPALLIVHILTVYLY